MTATPTRRTPLPRTPKKLEALRLLAARPGGMPRAELTRPDGPFRMRTKKKHRLFEVTRLARVGWVCERRDVLPKAWPNPRSPQPVWVQLNWQHPQIDELLALLNRPDAP